ncbi:MAG: insulinase family protein [Nanoarchaeota archaeon]|nr:insulinase family protein [Nanoarchaeota archaeon]
MKCDFYKKVLKNGMIILFEKRNIPVVSVAFAVKNGGINELSDEKGISHFIEHMVFKGTTTRNFKQISQEIEKNGGVLNAFTDEIVTVYFCKMPSQHSDIALNVLGDVVRNPLFDEKELEKERKVIFEEIKMRKDNPMVHVVDEVQNLLYENPLGLNLIGNYETMGSLDRKKLMNRFNSVHTPNNMILCVVGDMEFNDLVKFAEKNFPTKEGKVPKFKVNKKIGTKIEKRKGLDQANLVFAYHVPLANDKKNYAAQVLSTLMAEGMSSRLFLEIREKRNLAYAVKGESNINKDFAYNLVRVGTTKENVEKVKQLILEEFKKVSEELTEEELRQVKEQMIGNYQIAMEESQNQMVNLIFSELNGKAEDFYTFEDKIRTVNLEDVKSLAIIKDYSFMALVPE